MARIVPEDHIRRPLTPENFPFIFTQIPVEQLRQMPSVEFADLIPKRYYLFLSRHDILHLIYICKNYPRSREFAYKIVYYQTGGPVNRWIESEMDDTFRLTYEQFGSANTKWYDLATGFGNADGQVQLDPDSVELLECEREPGPVERRVRGMLGIGGRRYKKRSTRRCAKNKSMRRSHRKVRRTRRQRGGDRTAEGLQKYLTDKLTPYTIEMAPLEGKRIIIKNNGTDVFLGYIVLPEGELGVDLDKNINGSSIKSHIEAWLKETVPIAE